MPKELGLKGEGRGAFVCFVIGVLSKVAREEKAGVLDTLTGALRLPLFVFTSGRGGELRIGRSIRFFRRFQALEGCCILAKRVEGVRVWFDSLFRRKLPRRLLIR